MILTIKSIARPINSKQGAATGSETGCAETTSWGS